MIREYLRQIDEILTTSPAVIDVVIVRRSIWDTEFETLLNYRYRVIMSDGSVVEMTERVVHAQGLLEVTKYRHHWQDAGGHLIKRWDNAPHHPTVDTFPHHLHDATGNRVVNHPPITGLEVVRRIVAEVETQLSQKNE